MHLRQMSFAPVVAGSFEIKDAEEQPQRQPQTVRQPSGEPVKAPRERWIALVVVFMMYGSSTAFRRFS